MKKSIVLAALAISAVSGVANAASICTAPAAAGDGTAITGGTNFVKNTFTPKCSANVRMNAVENQVAMGVASGSSKGKNVFSGSTNGGSVKPTGTTCTNGCTTTEVSDSVAQSQIPS